MWYTETYLNKKPQNCEHQITVCQFIVWFIKHFPLKLHYSLTSLYVISFTDGSEECMFSTEMNYVIVSRKLHGIELSPDMHVACDDK